MDSGYTIWISNPFPRAEKKPAYTEVKSRVENQPEAAFIDFGAGRHGFLPLKKFHAIFPQTPSEIKGRVNIKDVIKEDRN